MNDKNLSIDTSSPVRHRSRLASLFIVLVGLGLLGTLGWYLAHRNAANPGPRAGNRVRPSATVGFAAAKNADIPIRLEALGTVTPLAVATVRPQVSGVLTQILYQEGQRVERGEALAQIDPRPFQLALDQATGQLARDEAQLINARVVLERDRNLLAQDSIAQQDVDTQAATTKQLEGTVEADRAAVGTARLNLAYSRVTAPIGGRVGLRPVDIGNTVSTADTSGIATITQVAPIDVVFTLPADSVTAVEERVKAKAELPVTVLDRTRANVLGQGTFLTLDNQIDSQTGTVRAKARFTNEQGTLFPNQFVNVQVQLNVVQNAIVVPAAAIRHGPRGDFVYVIAADHTAHIRYVKLGPAIDDRASISSGLKVDEQVVTEGGDRLTDGSTVRLPGQKVGGAGPGQSQQPGRHGRRHKPSGDSGG